MEEARQERVQVLPGTNPVRNNVYLPVHSVLVNFTIIGILMLFCHEKLLKMFLLGSKSVGVRV